MEDEAPQLPMVYSKKDLDDFLQATLEDCDNTLAERLSSLLSVANLVEVRNDFEQRLVTYMGQIEERNAERAKEHSHQLLEVLH